MRKGIVWLLTGILLIFAACAGKESGDAGSGQEDIASAVALLEQVWASYAEEERFPAAGGDYENSVMDQPGTFDITNQEALQSMLYVPQEAVEQIDDAALLMHMMNVNTFTAGAFHVKDAAGAEAFAQAMKDNIEKAQWICGTPEKLLIISVGNDYVVTAFGAEELMDVFQEKLTAKYQSADIFYEAEIIE